MPGLKITIQITDAEATRIKNWQAQGLIESDDEVLDALLTMRKPAKVQSLGTWILFTLARLVAVGMLIWAVDSPFWMARHSYDYYQLLKIAVCTTSAFGIYCAYSWKKNGWIWPFIVLVVVFNPLVAVALGREAWQVVDVIAGVFIVASIICLRPENIPFVKG